MCSLARASHPFLVSERGGRTFPFFAATVSGRDPGSSRILLERSWMIAAAELFIFYALGLIPSCEVQSVFPACTSNTLWLISTSLACMAPRSCFHSQPFLTVAAKEKWWPVTAAKENDLWLLPSHCQHTESQTWAHWLCELQNQRAALGFQQTQVRPPWLEQKVKSSPVCWEVEEHNLGTEGQRFKMLLWLTEISKICVILPPQRSTINSSCLVCCVIYCRACKILAVVKHVCTLPIKQQIWRKDFLDVVQSV